MFHLIIPRIQQLQLIIKHAEVYLAKVAKATVEVMVTLVVVEPLILVKILILVDQMVPMALDIMVVMVQMPLL